jgi:two-component system, OmpR family, sensor histidine kinase PhoQ
VHSLSRRLLISISLPIVLFFAVMLLVLDRGFRDLADRSLQEVLDAQMVALISAAEPQPGGGYAPPASDLPARLRAPGSGLYAQIRSAGGRALWRSPSAAGSTIEFGPPLDPGARRLSYGRSGHERLALLSRGIQFEDREGSWEFTFSVAVSLTPYEQQLWHFRRILFGWFIGLMLLLLITLAALLRWVLAPVRRLEREIQGVETGRSETLGSGYPRELAGVAANLNTLLVGERKRVSRYRDTLGNLAHSLKTPLAVMRSALSPRDSSLLPEIDRMRDIIEHQLKRAAASGGALLGQAPVDVATVVAELRSTLLKVHAEKDLAIEVDVEPGTQFLGDRGDLTELLGNLLDNACKWCRSRIRVTGRTETGTNPRQRLLLTVEDDGPGIAPEHRGRIGERGLRSDETVPGHGIGLAMVQDTIELYGGAWLCESSALGGARFAVRLPAPTR